VAQITSVIAQSMEATSIYEYWRVKTKRLEMVAGTGMSLVCAKGEGW